MSGQLWPVILYSRFSTLVGGGAFYSLPLDVARFRAARLSIWRGQLVGASPAFSFVFMESSDRTTWSQIGSPADPGAGQEAMVSVEFSRQFFQVGALLSGADTAVSCFAYGFLELRH